MNQFSIKDVEALTGIKQHTLRIWEQRYNFIKPKRTNTNIRFYDDDDLKLLLNISLLNKNGFKISKIAKLSNNEIEEIILEFGNQSDNKLYQLHTLTGCMLNLDEYNFEQIIRNNFTMHGVAKTMTDLIFPFLNHIGVLWMSGAVNPAFEHFITNMIRSKLIVATDMLGYHKLSKHNGKKYLLFLPSGETHEIGLLFANYYFRSLGHHTMYLGQNLPANELQVIIQTYKPDYIFTSVTIPLTPKKMKTFLDALMSETIKVPVMLTGRILNELELPLPKHFHKIFSIDDLKPFC